MRRSRSCNESGGRRLMAALALCAALAPPAPAGAVRRNERARQPLPAAEAISDKPRPGAIRGEVVETACFVMAGRRGAQHRQCALACARAGQPLGIVDNKTGRLHVSLHTPSDGDTSPDPLLEFVGRSVDVTGTIHERGQLRGIVVRTVRPFGTRKKTDSD